MADSEPVTDQPSAPGTDDAGLREPHHARHGSTRRGGRGLGFIRETAIIVVSALVLSWLIKSFLVQAFFIPSASMEDTLTEGDRVMVTRLVPEVFDVHRGDVVVFKDPGGWLDPMAPVDRGPVGNAVAEVMTFVGLLPQDTGEHLIKRVIGTPGDEVVCCDAEGRVTINGVPIDEGSYLKPGSEPSEVDFEVTVPDGMLFVLGDNRQNSRDSRYNEGSPGGGFVPMSNVVGTAFATVWPFDRAIWLRNPGDVFAGVPEP